MLILLTSLLHPVTDDRRSKKGVCLWTCGLLFKDLQTNTPYSFLREFQLQRSETTCNVIKSCGQSPCNRYDRILETIERSSFLTIHCHHNPRIRSIDRGYRSYRRVPKKGRKMTRQERHLTRFTLVCAYRYIIYPPQHGDLTI